MTRGVLEVLLVDACILKDTDLIGKMDPYVLIKFGDQKLWNEKIKFDIRDYAGNTSDDGHHPQYKLSFKIMDKDTFSKDDFVGELTIYVDDLLAQGMVNGKADVPPCNYSIVGGSKQSENGAGEHENEEEKSGKKKHGFHLHSKNDGEKKSGGWKKAFKHHGKNDGEAEEEEEGEEAEAESVSSESDQEEEEEAGEAEEAGEEEGNVFEKLGALLESLGGL
ncbi:hypothetical protein MKW94_022584 [Papaver nudicaule]|uniref:C2 domain-containing protein n=1 Tax=Papaver nudicaule TaxID=74823 RepID=A0AA41VTR1_PAPNU|nr:hypothetical protein [Papaver nudicaule]